MSPQDKLNHYLKSAMDAALGTEYKSTVSDHLLKALPAAIDALIEVTSSCNTSTSERLAAVSLICDLYGTLLQDAHARGRRKIKTKVNAIAKKRAEIEEKKVALRVHEAQQQIAEKLGELEEQPA